MVAAMMKGETVNVEADDIPAGEVSKRKRGEGRGGAYQHHHLQVTRQQ